MQIKFCVSRKPRLFTHVVCDAGVVASGPEVGSYYDMSALSEGDGVNWWRDSVNFVTSSVSYSPKSRFLAARVAPIVEFSTPLCCPVHQVVLPAHHCLPKSVCRKARIRPVRCKWSIGAAKQTFCGDFAVAACIALKRDVHGVFHSKRQGKFAKMGDQGRYCAIDVPRLLNPV